MFLTDVRVGAILPNLLCPSYDKGAFATCVLPVQMRRWNVWEFVYNADWGNAASVLDKIGELLDAEGVTFDHLRMRAEPPATPIVTHAGECPVNLSVRGSDATLLCEFVARDGPSAVPWLAYRSAPEGVLKPPGYDDLVETRCPVAADIVCRTVWAAPDEEIPEPPKSVLDKVTDAAGRTAGTALATYALWTGAGVLLLYGVYRLTR